MKQFDLEQDMMECWKVIQDLEIILNDLKNDGRMEKKDVIDVLSGMKILYDLKFDKMFTDFEEHLKEVKLRK